MEEAIVKQCSIIEETPEGQRNDQLNKSAFALGQLIHGGLPESRAVAALKCSALKIGLEEREIDNTIRSGISSGKKNPRVFNDRWENPDMRVVHRPMVVLPECPLHLFDKTVARFIEEAAACKCAPPDYVLAALLCGVAGLIGNARQVTIWEDWSEATALWFMLVGVPSCNKSPALDAVYPIIREFEARYQRKYKLEMQEYMRAVEQRKANKDLLSVTIEEEPVKPMVKRVIVQDATVEKLALVLAENVKGLICLRDELAGLLANLEKHGGNDRPFYLESFGGRPTTVDRVKYQESIFVPSVLLSIIGSIQPDKLDELMLKQPDDGLASRFLYVSGVPRKIKEPDVKPDYEMLRNMLEAIEKLEVPLDEHGTPKPKQITLPYG